MLVLMTHNKPMDLEYHDGTDFVAGKHGSVVKLAAFVKSSEDSRKFSQADKSHRDDLA